MADRTNVVTRAFWVLKNEGIKMFFDKTVVNIKNFDKRKNILEDLDFVMQNMPIPLNNDEKLKNSKLNKYTINWIVPEMGKGSGGHLNIFRIASFLENENFHNRIYTTESIHHHTNKSLKDFVLENYPITSPDIEFIAGVENVTYANVTFATGWQTAYFLNNFNNTDLKCYFVQDFEPYFYPVGSLYFLAENTYKMGFYGIVAGDWLKEKLNKEYGMETESFNFSYDKGLYRPHKFSDFSHKIFFYARPCTERRCFETGVLALNKIVNTIGNINVIFAGEKLNRYNVHFNHEDLGSVPIDKLTDIYGDCDFCLVLSGTNLSLLPLEIMASGSVVVSNSGDNNWLLTKENSILTTNDPNDIADAVIQAYGNIDKVKSLHENGLKVASDSSWEKEAKKIEKSLLKLLKDK